MLTKDDIAAIRKADMLSVHLSSQNPQGLVRLIKNKPHNAGPFETDQEYHWQNVKVIVETMMGTNAVQRGVAQCHELVYFYHDQGTPASSIMKTLRVGDEITLSFYPDAHSNGYVAAAGLHADALYLHVRRNGKRQSWKLAVSICPDNSARMCHGVPKSSDYDEAAVSARKLA